MDKEIERLNSVELENQELIKRINQLNSHTQTLEEKVAKSEKKNDTLSKLNKAKDDILTRKKIKMESDVEQLIKENDGLKLKIQRQSQDRL